MPLRALSIHTVPGPARSLRAVPIALRPTTTSELSPTEWMVSDASTAVGTTSAILGFIQLHPATVTPVTFEVTKIGGSRIEFSTFRTLAEAVAALSEKPLRRLNLVPAPPRR